MRAPAVPIRSLLVPTVGAVVVLVVALLVRSGPPAPPAATATSTAVRSGHVTVAIANYAFAPRTLTVRAGTRVTWTNSDATAHTATADGGAFDTGTINPKHSKTVDLRKPGTYAYHCVFHAFMTATVKVVG